MPTSRDRAPRSLDHNPEAVVWARKRSGMSQGQLARLINVSAGHMSEIESGSRNAPPALLQRIATTLKCPVSMLERRIEAAFAHNPDAVVWARKRSGMSQDQLARLINVSASRMFEIESGSRSTSAALRQEIAAALNCPVSMLERRVEAANE